MLSLMLDGSLLSAFATDSLVSAQVLEHYKAKVATIAADKPLKEVAEQIEKSL